MRIKTNESKILWYFIQKIGFKKIENKIKIKIKRESLKIQRETGLCFLKNILTTHTHEHDYSSLLLQTVPSISFRIFRLKTKKFNSVVSKLEPIIGNLFDKNHKLFKLSTLISVG